MKLLNKDFKFVKKKNDLLEITNIFIVFFFKIGQLKKSQQIIEFKEKNCVNVFLFYTKIALIFLIIKWFIDV